MFIDVTQSCTADDLLIEVGVICFWVRTCVCFDFECFECQYNTCWWCRLHAIDPCVTGGNIHKKESVAVPPRAMQWPKTMSMWTLSKNLWCFAMSLPRAGIVIDAKWPMVGGSSPPANRDAFWKQQSGETRCKICYSQKSCAVLIHQTLFYSHMLQECTLEGWVEGCEGCDESRP